MVHDPSVADASPIIFGYIYSLRPVVLLATICVCLLFNLALLFSPVPLSC